MSSRAKRLSSAAEVEIPVTPSRERWLAMNAAEREAHVHLATMALQRQQELMGEGRPHAIARGTAISTLGEFFGRIGRKIYLADELPVLYAEEPSFCPDILAVVDVEDPGQDDRRSCWDVEIEGRGLDLVIEILNNGDRQKDLVSNVARYARLEISEYFVYDCNRQALYGYHLPLRGTRNYQSISNRSGRLPSTVLQLELGIVDGHLRFFYGEALVPETRELISRLDAMLEQRERRLVEETAAREAEAEARVAAERRAAEAEAKLAELLKRLEQRGE